jgi:hypothetical protein
MQLKYISTYWGQEALSAEEFIWKVIDAGYDGIEINLPDSSAFIDAFFRELHVVRSQKEFLLVAQQVLPPATESVVSYISRMSARLGALAALRPDFINAHTGKDYYSFDDNCRAIEAVENISAKTGIRILHETHRGRFTFHPYSLLPYLEKFPSMELTGDFSHWCTVCESMLSDQEVILQRIVPHVGHIHARIGYEHSPQVNDPAAPEWKHHVDQFIGWWQAIILQKEKSGWDFLTICPEFGPAPYMPTLPFTRQPIGNQWQINRSMKDRLKKVFC